MPCQWQGDQRIDRRYREHGIPGSNAMSNSSKAGHGFSSSNACGSASDSCDGPASVIDAMKIIVAGSRLKKLIDGFARSGPMSVVIHNQHPAWVQQRK